MLRTLIPTLAALAVTSVAATTAGAGPTGRSATFHMPSVAGAIGERPDLARSAEEVRRQGGLATAGAVRWLVQASGETVRRTAIPMPSVVGAMREDRALARSAEEVRAQRGFATAGAVRWLARAPADLELAAY